MIFYFSGTGNSLYAARHLAKATQDRLISIPEEMSDPAFSKEYALSTDERIGFVFPIHSWGPPEIVLRFIRRIRFANYQNHYCFFVATCGDDMGCTQQILKQALSGIHINLHAGFSLIMPNTYIALPGFDVDSPEVQKRKLEDAVPELERMESDVCRKTNTFRLHPGGMPRLKSYLILPLFRKFLINEMRTDMPDKQHQDRKQTPGVARSLYGLPGLLSCLSPTGSLLLCEKEQRSIFAPGFIEIWKRTSLKETQPKPGYWRHVRLR